MASIATTACRLQRNDMRGETVKENKERTPKIKKRDSPPYLRGLSEPSSGFRRLLRLAMKVDDREGKSGG